MRNRRWSYPLDPDCPGAQREVFGRIESMNSDPMTQAYGAPVGEFARSWRRKHKKSCERCQKYGARHAEVS